MHGCHPPESMHVTGAMQGIRPRRDDCRVDAGQRSFRTACLAPARKQVIRIKQVMRNDPPMLTAMIMMRVVLLLGFPFGEMRSSIELRSGSIVGAGVAGGLGGGGGTGCPATYLARMHSPKFLSASTRLANLTCASDKLRCHSQTLRN